MIDVRTVNGECATAIALEALWRRLHVSGARKAKQVQRPCTSSERGTQRRHHQHGAEPSRTTVAGGQRPRAWCHSGVASWNLSWLSKQAKHCAPCTTTPGTEGPCLPGLTSLPRAFPLV